MSFKIKRINARKVVFSYFYARLKNEYVFNYLDNIISDKYLNNVDKRGDVFFIKKNKNLSEEELNIIKDIYNLEEENVDININKMDDFNFYKDIEYIINNFFAIEKHKELIDIDYVNIIGSKYSYYKEEVKENIDKYLTKFKFSEMDYVDRAIFLLWYIEFKVLSTPVKVIQNEMVELAKRYWDSGSDKLINAVFYKLFG